MKSEFLYHYHNEHGLSLRSRLFGHIGAINNLASYFPKIFNSLNQSAFTKKILDKIGIAKERELPPLALERFSAWFTKHQQNIANGAQQVVLFNDTFNEFNQPSIGQAAVKVLNALGYQVISPKWQCCGRTYLSKGMLKEAKSKANTLIKSLLPYAQKGIPIIGLEPSCILTLKDDYESLLGSNFPNIKLFMESCLTLDEFLFELIKNEKFNLKFNQNINQVKLHGHCHQKALVGTIATMNVLKKIGCQVSEIDSGCCGMAGSFGYEKEHYKISMQIANLKLLPAVRASDENTLIVANGISCRSQIAQGTSRKAFHLAEVIADCILAPSEHDYE